MMENEAEPGLISMRPSSVVPVVIIALAVAMAMPYVAAASYTLTINPNVPVSLGTTISLALSLTGGIKNAAYTVTFQVVKPNGTGSATTSRMINTNNQGVCSPCVSVNYPDPSFTAQSGTVATDIGGIYNVIVNQTAPSNIGIVQSGQFTVSSTLTVVTSQPLAGSSFKRGSTATISVTVSSLSGTDTGATVTANTPSGGRIFLPQTGVGIYSTPYMIASSDPTGPWTIIVQASDSQGNSGTSSPVGVTITKNDLIVDSLVTYNSKGTPTTTFSPGDTIYAFFRIRYSSGTYLTTGEYSVGLKNPSGTLVANLTAAYDNGLFGFYTSTGYPVSAFDPGGTWTVVINTNSLNDGYGNTGPGLTTSVPLQIVTSPLSYWPFIVAAIIGVGGAVATFKRFDTTLEGFQHLEQMMGGPVPRGASLLLIGDPGSGKTILSYQLLHDELESGKLCALLSYDAFPEDVQARMNEFGWDIVSPLRKGRLKIIDCYSSLAGQGEGAIKDPSDLTELNIQVTAFIGKAKGSPVTVVLDSLTPIFNGVEEKQAINFIQTLGAKIKKTGGLFILTASRGAIPDESAAKIKTMVDGVMELTIVRGRGRAHRFLSIAKMERRRITSGPVPFEIDRSRGLVFRVSRLGLFKKQIIDFLRLHHIIKGTGSLVNKPESQSSRASLNRQR